LPLRRGCDPRHPGGVTIDPALVRYGRGQRIDLQSRILETFRSAPWVQAAGWSVALPLQGRMQWLVEVDGYAASEVLNPDANVVSDGYFEVLGIPLIAGRTFAASDSEQSERVAIISQALARKCWPGGRAVGGRVALDPSPGNTQWATVIGIVGDVRRGFERQAEPMIYVPLSQHGNMAEFNGQHLFVRSTQPAETAARES